MGSTCVRCSQAVDPPSRGALCAACGARVRALLAARAGVRHARERPLVWPLGAVALIALATVMAILRQFSTGAMEDMLTQRGVWRVLGGAQFISPVGMAADHLGNLYVIDAANYRIDKLGADGTLLATFGNRGVAPGQFDRPTAVALDPIGNLYVADTGSSRIQKLSSTGVP